MIYFVTARAIGQVKIGYSNDPARRVQGLRTGSPTPLALERVCEGDPLDERRLHLRFVDARLTGEWFSLTPEIEAFMATLPVQPVKPASMNKRLVAVGISKGHASAILSGKQNPSRPLAIHILRKTGWRHAVIADLSDAQIDTLEAVEPWSARIAPVATSGVFA